MLFNSYTFILAFLPTVLIIFYSLGGKGKQFAAISWLVFASLFFYAWWNPIYIILLLGSIAVNYSIGLLFNVNTVKIKNRSIANKILLISGIFINLGVLGYFKYANFFVDSGNTLLGNSFHLNTIILPLAISFFTFQQVTYLIDSYRGKVKEHSLIHYCLFVTFFPQLIAGPIVHHKEMMPQFFKTTIARFSHKKFVIGISIFIVGLFKKVIIADNIALYSTPMFDAAAQGISISFIEAWCGALSYTFQLYFDFSGYSDMAVGIGFMFGIRLALNFYSPYKANNIISFWRRWHITLSRFLREYLYIPLGGNRHGVFRRYLSLMIVMVIGGLWHGAGWTFVVWGALHGFYLLINHMWVSIKSKLFISGESRTLFWTSMARIVTFIAIVVAWVFFRAENLPTAFVIIEAMSGKNGIILPLGYLDHANYFFSVGDFLFAHDVRFEENVPLFGGFLQLAFLGMLLIIVWYLPNTHELFHKYSPFMDTTKISTTNTSFRKLSWFPYPLYAIGVMTMLLIVLFSMDGTSEFLYFQF